jgi:hypothetical protein
MTRNVFFGKASVFLGALLALAGCENNLTTQGLCNSSNTIERLPGLSGTYSLSIQRQDFTVDKKIFEVKSESGKLAVQTQDDNDGEESTSVVCGLGNGWVVMQTHHHESNLYSYNRLTVGATGYLVTGIFFDKTKLDQAGVPNKVTEGLRQFSAVRSLATSGLLGSLDEEGQSSLVIDNASVESDLMLQAMHTSPIGFGLVRE